MPPAVSLLATGPRWDVTVIRRLRVSPQQPVTQLIFGAGIEPASVMRIPESGRESAKLLP
jgi:hypothetical protein